MYGKKFTVKYGVKDLNKIEAFFYHILLELMRHGNKIQVASLGEPL